MAHADSLSSTGSSISSDKLSLNEILEQDASLAQDAPFKREVPPIPNRTPSLEILYNVTSGLQTGVTDKWYVTVLLFSCTILQSPRQAAGHFTQGILGGHVYKMQVVVPNHGRRRRHCVAYVVFEGLAPGIYNAWYVLNYSSHWVSLLIPYCDSFG